MELIHFNFGLHDLRYKKDGQPHNTLRLYRKNLKNCIRYLKKIAPQASLVFANTTPVPKGALRHNTGDARKYNSHASKVLRQYPEIQLNDLYSFVKTNPLRWKAPVDVHFNKEGYSALGIRVAQFILKALSVNRANSLYTFELTIYVKIPA